MTLAPRVCLAPRCPLLGRRFQPRRVSQRTCSGACRQRLARSENTGRRPLKSHQHAVVIHGARSPEHVAIRAKEVRSRIMDVIPWATEDVFAESVARYCAAAAQEELLSEYVDRVTAEEGVEKIPMKVFEALNASRRLAWQLSADLGMTPHGRSALKKLSLEGESIENTLQHLIDTSPRRQIAADIEIEAHDDDND